MKILLLITDLEIGGTPTVVRELAIRLKQTSDVTVACLSRQGPVGDQLREAGVRVIAFDASAAAQLFSTASRLIWLIRRERFNVVFSFLIHANAVAAMASRFCPGVRFLQSIQTTQPKPRWHWQLQSLVHHAADRIVVPSPSAAQAAMEWADVAPEKIVVIANAVECGIGIGSGTGGPPVSFFENEEDHGRAARATTTSRIGFIGRLDPIKRIPDLLEAMTLLDDHFMLDIFGDGEDRPRIEQTIARFKLQNRVKLHGTIARPQDALASIDVLVLPSAAEGFGLVLIEAMAAGVPVVATDVPGIRDVVQDEVNGLLAPVGSPKVLARALRRVCEELHLRDRLVRNGFARVQEHFSWSTVLPQYKMLLKLPS